MPIPGEYRTPLAANWPWLHESLMSLPNLPCNVGQTRTLPPNLSSPSLSFRVRFTLQSHGSPSLPRLPPCLLLFPLINPCTFSPVLLSDSWRPQTNPCTEQCETKCIVLESGPNPVFYVMRSYGLPLESNQQVSKHWRRIPRVWRDCEWFKFIALLK